MASDNFGVAQSAFASALKLSPDDYAGHFRMAQCLQAQNKSQEARQFAQRAQAIYPQEAQAHKLSGVLSLSLRDPSAAFEGLDRFDRALPGDPGVLFLKGVSLEGMGQRQQAAQHYARFLQSSQQGPAATFAVSRLQEWGMVR